MRRLILATVIPLCLTVAACENDVKSPQTTVRGLGMFPNYGEWATAGATDTTKDVPDSRFEYFAVLYIKFTENGGPVKLVARYAIFKKSGTKAEVDAYFVKLLANRFRETPSHGDGDWTTVDAGEFPEMRTDQKRLPTKRLNEKNFYFRVPSRIYVVVDNDSIEFNENYPVIFSPYGSEARNNPNPNNWTPTQENHSFFKAKRGNVAGIPTNRAKQVLYFENQYRDANGELMTPGNANNPEIPYSINFNLDMEVRGATNWRMPLVFDPDTGNGNGQPPPVKP